MTEKTLPKSTGVDEKTDSSLLSHGRYGTVDMIGIWGPDATFQYSLDAIATAVEVMSRLHPDIANPVYAKEIAANAKLGIINPNRIREIEAKTGHDIIAITKALEEKVSKEAASLINQARTSADTTETAKALQLKKSLEIVIDSVENLRDIILEKAYEWIGIIYMDQTHGLDALPGVAGGILVNYAETLQSDLNHLAFVCRNSIKGKWADATGRHHSATTLGIDGMELEEEYCKRLGVGHMVAPLQVPSREFVMDVVYAMARTAETMNNIASYIAWGKNDDVNLFLDKGVRRKGSSGMPHKDAKGGNPTTEEQTKSYANYMEGALKTMTAACVMNPSRDLSGSASDRITLEDVFKWGDFVIRRLASTVFNLGINEVRSIERVKRTYGVVTSERVLTYLTDRRKVSNPMPRSEAHDLLGRLATEAYTERKPFAEVLAKNEEVSKRLPMNIIIELTDPLTYLGESKRVVQIVYDSFHGKKTLV